jgi:hypothetical protein
MVRRSKMKTLVRVRFTNIRRFQLALPLCTVVLLAAATMQAGVTTYTSQPAFDAATNGLSTQTFATVAANVGVGPGGIAEFNNPLDNATNSGSHSICLEQHDRRIPACLNCPETGL